MHTPFMTASSQNRISQRYQLAGEIECSSPTSWTDYQSWGMTLGGNFSQSSLDTVNIAISPFTEIRKNYDFTNSPFKATTDINGILAGDYGISSSSSCRKTYRSQLMKQRVWNILLPPTGQVCRPLWELTLCQVWEVAAQRNLTGLSRKFSL